MHGYTITHKRLIIYFYYFSIFNMPIIKSSYTLYNANYRSSIRKHIIKFKLFYNLINKPIKKLLYTYTQKI